MATSPNYGWLEPDNTDLVKNGALAIRTLGNAIDTTMATMVPKSIVDAKGDLIAGTAADTAARLAVGNNGETLVADSSTATGLRYQAPVNVNPILNSAAQVWQRGTSIAFSASVGYFADRWYGYCVPAGVFSRQATNDTINLPFIQYCMRIQRNSGNTNTGLIQISQSMETINSIAYAGKTITFSFYARRGANYSAASNLMTAFLITGTGTDQNISAGYTGGANAIFQTPALTTTWTRYTYSATLPTTTTEIAVGFDYTPTGTAGAADYFEVTGVQLEVGSVATPFKTYAGTIQGELAACQRYYYRNTPGVTYGSYSATGVGFNGTTAVLTCLVPVPMRTNPSTTVEFSAINLIDGTNSYAVTAASMAAVQTGNFGVFVTFNAASGLVQYRPYSLGSNNNANAYLGFSAEL